jgi:hypothetical protein
MHRFNSSFGQLRKVDSPSMTIQRRGSAARHVRVEPAQLAIDHLQAAGITFLIPNVESQNPQAPAGLTARSLD